MCTREKGREPYMETLSVIIPNYNEERTIIKILERVNEVVLLNEMQKEVLVVDDCSTDATAQLVQNYRLEHPSVNLRYFRQEFNQGKGAAIHRGIKESSGDYIVVQDADLEYNPEEYNDLLKPIIEGYADVVYGSRFMGGNPHRILFFWHSMGNNFLTFISNIFTNLNLTDMETCYKLFRADLLKSLHLEEKQFGFEPEVTAKISRIPNIRIYEIGISYFGRTYQEGKKVNWRDGLRALYCVLKYNVWAR